MTVASPGHDRIRAQGYDTDDDVHHQQRRHALDELGHELGYGVFFIADRRREIIVRRLFSDRFVSRHEVLYDVAQVVSPTTFRGTVPVSQSYAPLKATQSELPTRTFTPPMTERSSRKESFLLRCASSIISSRRARLIPGVIKYALEFAKVAVGFAVELGGWDE